MISGLILVFFVGRGLSRDIGSGTQGIYPLNRKGGFHMGRELRPCVPSARNPPSIRRGRFRRRFVSRRRERLLHGLRRVLGWQHAYKTARAALIFKTNVPGRGGKERIVFPSPNVQPRLVPGAALANQNRSLMNQLARKTFHSQPLPGRVATVYRRPAAFFVCHSELPSFLSRSIPFQCLVSSYQPLVSFRGPSSPARGICSYICTAGNVMPRRSERP